MSTNLRKAQKHMQRAQELLNPQNFGFGTPGPIRRKRDKYNDMQLVSLSKKVQLRSINDEDRSILSDEHKQDFDRLKTLNEEVLRYIQNIDVVVRLQYVTEASTGEDGKFMCSVTHHRNDNLSDYLRATNQQYLKLRELHRHREGEEQYWVLHCDNPIFCRGSFA